MGVSLGGFIGRVYFGIEYVDVEVVEGRFEEVVFGVVFEEGVVYGGGFYLWVRGSSCVSLGRVVRGLGYY